MRKEILDGFQPSEEFFERKLESNLVPIFGTQKKSATLEKILEREKVEEALGKTAS